MNRFQQYLSEEFAEDYEEGRLSRREALKLIAAVSGSAVVANAILAACSPQESATQAVAAGDTNTPESPAEETAPTETSSAPASVTGGTVAPDDPAVVAETVQFPGDDGAALTAYLARPASDGSFPVVLVCHENRGLTDHIRDVTRRLAKAGYAGLAVDLLSRQGGSEAVGSGSVPGALGNINPEQFAADFRGGWAYLQGQTYAQAGRVGMVGFCFGGGVTWLVAARMPELKAAVPYYGPHPPVADVPAINAPVLAIYGELDARINAGIPAIGAAMAEHGKIYEKVIYPNADHAFHNDTGPRYVPEAAMDAWARTLAWFGQHL